MRPYFRRMWFELVTPPVRPRNQAVYMRADFIKDDNKFTQLRDEQFARWCAKPSRFAAPTVTVNTQAH